MPQIAIIGRQNVGKSTLFNALIGRRRSIVYDKPGVTRDLVVERVEWGTGSWTMTDFPGFEDIEADDDDELTRIAIEKAIEHLGDYNLLLWVISRKGLSTFDYKLGEMLRRANRRVWLVVNFVDDPSLEAESMEAYSLGIADVFFVSALNKRGIRDLREKTISAFRGREDEEPTPALPANALRLAIIGKPNAGKSTLFNRLLQKEKALTSNIPGTTRDALEDIFIYQGKPVYLVDTAGLRRRRNVHEDVEFYSMRRTHEAIEKADVIVLLIDPHEKLDKQNKTLIQSIADVGKPMILGINKHDLIKEDKEGRTLLEEDIEDLQRQTWKFPWYFISALDGRRTGKMIEKAFELKERAAVRIGTGELNRILERLKRNPVLQSNHVKLLYITQLWPGVRFVVFSNREKLMPNIRRYLESSLMQTLDLKEFPLRVENRKKTGKERK